MLQLPQMLMIGGATRNLGKTTLITRIVHHFAHEYLVGLKIKTLRQGDEAFHGKGSHQLIGDYLVVEESVLSNDDTGRIFQAGAKQVFHIKAKAEALEQALAEFMQSIPPQATIVCESNSARSLLEPGLFLMIKSSQRPNDMKPSARELEHLADRIVWSDGQQHDFEPSSLSYQNHKWTLANLS